MTARDKTSHLGGDRGEKPAPGRRYADRIARRALDPRPLPEAVEVDNPFWSRAHAGDRTNPRRITVLRNSNESPLVLLESRGAVTPDQAAAGTRFRDLYERIMAGTPSPGDLRERVDGGGRLDAMSDRRIDAGRQLRRAADRLGPAGYWLVRAVCGDGASIREIARRTHVRRPAALTALRWALDELAETWNLASEGSGKARRMTYRIDYQQNARVTGSENWTGTFADAKHTAVNAVDVGTCDRAEIYDDAGKLLFHHPRITRPA